MNQPRKEIQNGTGIKVLRAEKGYLYLEGYPYPYKGIPTIEHIERANWLKRNLFNPWKYSCPLPEYPTAFAKEFTNLSHVLAYIFEYDQAYRFRMQDLFAETTKEKLLTKPIQEILRLLAIHKERDYPEIHRKFRFYFTLLICTLSIPPLRGILLKRLSKVNYQNLLPDENDIYWMSQKTDYEYRKKGSKSSKESNGLVQ